MKVYLAHSTHFDFKEKLYKPLRGSALHTEHEINLPHETEDPPTISRDMIKNCDVLVAEVSVPSFGVGIEIGWADAFGVPIIGMVERGAKVSWSVDNELTDRFEYESADDLIEKLTAALAKLKR